MYSGRAIWGKRGRSFTVTNLPGFPPALKTHEQENLGDALFAAAQHWGVSLHVNKALQAPLPKQTQPGTRQ